MLYGAARERSILKRHNQSSVLEHVLRFYSTLISSLVFVVLQSWWTSGLNNREDFL